MISGLPHVLELTTLSSGAKGHLPAPLHAQLSSEVPLADRHTGGCGSRCEGQFWGWTKNARAVGQRDAAIPHTRDSCSSIQHCQRPVSC